jgi:AraC-like DNA-binding protein
MREPTVAASWPRSLVEFAAARGADADSLMLAACIEVSDLTDAASRVPLERYVALMSAAIEQCNDPGLALAFGEHVSMDNLSIVALIATNAETAQDSQATINKYSALIVDDGEDSGTPAVELVHRDGKLWIKLGSSIYSRYPAITEAGIARVVGGARSLLKSMGGASTKSFPDAIHFTYPEPAHRAEYDRFFGVPLVFDSDMNAIAVDPALLALPMPKQFSAAAATLTKHADDMLSRLRTTNTTRASVETALAARFESGDVRMEIIAQDLGLSRATLFRRLKAERVTFDVVLSELRQRRALQMLNQEKRSVQQTAHLLGFSDPAAFSRAFKRWTGVSPKHLLMVR